MSGLTLCAFCTPNFPVAKLRKEIKYSQSNVVNLSICHMTWIKSLLLFDWRREKMQSAFKIACAKNAGFADWSRIEWHANASNGCNRDVNWNLIGNTLAQCILCTYFSRSTQMEMDKTTK